MSVLSYLNEYGSDSDGDTEKSKLPPPNLSKVSVAPADVHIDDPELHSGRKRSFSHVRGNWCTFVYVNYFEEERENLLKFINFLQTELSVEVACQRSEDFHISLSKTVTLKYHLINPFTSALQKILEKFNSFQLGFESLRVYCNEEGTRTFVALAVDFFCQRSLLELSKAIDSILRDYNLPTFYEDPSFHMSILWINGNRKEEIENFINRSKSITNNISQQLDTVIIKKINCKSGNRYFQYFLN